MRLKIPLVILVILLAVPLAVLAQEPGATPTPITTPAPVEENAPIIHIVEEGETLYGIATSYGTTVTALLYLNGLTEESLIVPGQQLVVSGEVPEPTPTPDPDDPANDPTLPKIHRVQSGDTLVSIAEQYGVSLDQLLRVNRLNPDAVLSVGQELLVPGAPGAVVATVMTVGFGDTLQDIAARYDTTPDAVITANQLINPDHLVAGQQLSVTSRTGSDKPHPLTGGAHFVAPGETPLTIAAKNGMSPVTLERLNDQMEMRTVLPGTRLRVEGNDRFRWLPGRWSELTVAPAPRQGYTFAVHAATDGGDAVFGRIDHSSGYSQTLRFMVDSQDGVHKAVSGLDAFADTGLYTVRLEDGAGHWFEQAIYVPDGGFGAQEIELPDALSDLLDYDLRAAEDQFLRAYYLQSGNDPLWRGVFEPPVAQGTVSADYGAARSYNGGPYLTYHAGTDYALPEGTPVIAPAPGVVVFRDITAIRGLLVILDHGMGIMSSYAHLSQASVAVGDTVETGQVIGAIGTSGSSTGYHLHWEIRVNDVAVNPVQWLEMPFP